MYNIKHKILVLPGINGRFLHTGTNVPDWMGTFVPATQMCVRVLTNYFFIFFLNFHNIEIQFLSKNITTFFSLYLQYYKILI